MFFEVVFIIEFKIFFFFVGRFISRNGIVFDIIFYCFFFVFIILKVCIFFEYIVFVK